MRELGPGPRGRNIWRRAFVFRGATKQGETPFEQAEVSTADELGLSELEAHGRGSCPCGRTFESPEAIKALDALTQEHLCEVCAQTVCPECSRVVSPVTSVFTLFGKQLCRECARAKVIRLVMGAIALLVPTAIAIWRFAE